MKRYSHESGATNPLLISSVLLGILVIVLGGGLIWAYGNYMDQKNNTDSKISVAVTAAKKTQTATDEATYFEKEKQPFTQFTGPDDLGHVTFNYPKTWSTYVAVDGSNGTYQAYLNPGSVPPVSTSQPYATRVVITAQDYSAALNGYQSLVKKGDLKSQPIVVNGFTGVRLDGVFSSTRTGSAVVFKVRDKTLTIATDSKTFQSDFDNTIVKSLDFNP